MFQHVETTAGSLDVVKIEPYLLEAGTWWQMAPPGLIQGRSLVVLTSDPDRFIREITEAAKDWKPPVP